MALNTTDILGLPAVVSTTGSDFYVPGSSVLGQVTSRVSLRSVMATGLPSIGAVTPSTNFTVPVVNLTDGNAYSISVNQFMTALHGVPAGGTTNQILGKLSNADYNIGWIVAGTVSSVGLTMPAVFSVANSPVTGAGTLAVTANGTSGGIPYFDTTSTMASSALLTANAIVLGGGAGTAPSVVGSLGSTTTVLHGNAAGAPTFGAVVLTADVSGILPVANGGTGVAAITAHYLLVGAGTSAATLLAPSATSGVPLISQGASSDPAYGTAVVAGGGTGLTSATAYAVLCGGTTSTGALQSIASVGTSGQHLISNGAGALPTFQTVNASNITVGTSVISGGTDTRVLYDNAGILGEYAQVPLANGGTNASLTASNGGIFYSTASAGAILAGTATANQALLSGSSAAPAWSTATYPATTTINQLLYSSSANVIAGLATANSGVLVTSAGGVPSISSTIPNATQLNITALGTIATGVWNGTAIGAQWGGTGAATLTTHAVVLGNGTSAVNFATIGTSGRLLIDQGASADPSFNAMSGDAAITNAGVLTIASNAVTYAKFQQAAGLSLLGVTGSSTANYGAITGIANQLPFVNSGGTALAFGGLSTLLDNVLGSQQGSITYRGASTWTVLSPGTSGQVLQTQGAGLNPTWAPAAGGGTVTSVTVSNQGLTINGVNGTVGGTFTSSGTITPIQSINAQTGTTYTVLSTDHTKLVTFNNASPCAVTLPQGTGASFGTGFWFEAENYGAGVVVITPTTSTIDGATLFYVGQNQGIKVTSDGTNYQVKRSVVPLGLPCGRLTLTTLTPVMTTSVTGATTIYYTPYNGSTVPVYNGTSFTPVSFSELSIANADTTKNPAAVGTFGSATNVPAAYDMFVWVDVSTPSAPVVRCTRGPGWNYGTSGSAIISTATPAVVTWTAHGLAEGAPVVVTGSTLPTGVSANTVYYVSRSPSTNSFNLSSSVANAAAGTSIGSGGSSSGTQTVTNYTGSTTGASPRGTGAGTTQLTLTNGVYLNTNAITNGPGALRGTYVGTFISDTSSQINYVLKPAAAAGGTNNILGVWNAYNQVPVISLCEDNTGGGWTYASATIRAANNSTSNRITWIDGLGRSYVRSDYAVNGFQTASGSGTVQTAVALDNTTAASGVKGATQVIFTGGNLAQQSFGYDYGIPQMGQHYYQAVEASQAVNSTTFGNLNGQNQGLSVLLNM